jgi:O-antigen/teichoic acid export membrane protein
MVRFWSSIAYVAAAAWMLGHGYDVPALLRVFVAMEYAVAIAYFLIINHRITRLRPPFRWSLAVSLVRDMRAFTGSSLIAALFARPEVVLLSLMVTEHEVGLYSAALRIIEIPLTLSEVLMVNVFPLLAASFGTAEERFRSWQGAAVRALMAFSFLFAACCLTTADQIVSVLYGEEFGAAATVLRILAINVVCASLISVFWRSLVARGRQGTNLALQAFTVGVRIATGVALILPLGAVGAALSSTLSSALHLSLLVRATARSGAPARLLRVGWRFAAAAAVAGLAMWGLTHWLTPVPSAVAGSVLYVPALLALSAITPEDRLLLAGMRASRARERESPRRRVSGS